MSVLNNDLILDGSKAREAAADNSQQSPRLPYLETFGETPVVPQREGVLSLSIYDGRYHAISFAAC